MSKIDDLKSQNPMLSTSIVDVLEGILPKTKYVELAINLIKKDSSKPATAETEEIRKETLNLLIGVNIRKELIEHKSYIELLAMLNLLNAFFTDEEFINLISFADFNERGLVKNKDITTYKTYEEIKREVEDINKREVEKLLEKQIVKIHDTEEWLILKPLTYEASCKYGYGTKWCTTFSDSSYFHKYVGRGILVYIINKKTNHKVAIFKNLDASEKKELSCWNVIDERIDSRESEVPRDVLDIVFEHLYTCKDTNDDIFNPSSYMKKELLDSSGIEEALANAGVQTTIRTQSTPDISRISTQLGPLGPEPGTSGYFEANTAAISDILARMVRETGGGLYREEAEMPDESDESYPF